MGRNIALVVAAGRGHRMGEGLPKQYRDLAGKTVLRRTLEALALSPHIHAIKVVIHPDDRDLYDLSTQGLDLLPVSFGGQTRQESVFLGLRSLEDEAPSAVLIHDAARPFITPATVDRVVAALDIHHGAIPCLAVVDTLKRSDGRTVGATVDRSGMWRAQTPQAFRYADILSAHRAMAGNELTDDAAVAEALGMAVALVEGDEANIKITSSQDLERAHMKLAVLRETRVGSGYDVHRFAPGTGVWLGGVLVAHDFGLEGHSDADVALHALTDAVLGAIGAGDIGQHFPPSDLQWKGASSDRFLAHAASLVAAQGGSIVHVDLTVICERPKLGPHREAITGRIAGILGIDRTRVSVKATTTEGLGFTGRKEGIAAMATATVSLPT